MKLQRLLLIIQRAFIVLCVSITVYSCTRKQMLMQPIVQNADAEARAFWEALNPSFATVFHFIDTTDLINVKPGTYILDDDNAWVIIMECDMKEQEKALLEIHDNYLDLQMPVSVAENYGYKLRSECKFPKAPLDTIKDIQFFDDPISELIEVQPGQFVVFDTCHAHAPTIGFGSIKKLVGEIRKR